MEDKIYTVTQITEILKTLIEDNFPSNFNITGEITNWSESPSGHIYFSIKDENSLIKCIIWRSTKIDKSFKDGDKVLIKGHLTIYEKQGQYQIIVEDIKLSGLGELYEKFLKLKEKLEKEGLFSFERKKPLPSYPLSIGIITSQTGSVLHDILNILKRRAPYLKKYLYPASVQGEGSEKSIIKGLKYFNRKKNVDIIIIARGGGSFEDLFVFNDERLAREIAKSKIPVVSAVGHQTDFTICDFVSDLRAPTPSAAAEIVVKNVDDIVDFLKRSEIEIKRELKKKITSLKQTFSSLKKTFFISTLVPINKKKEKIGFLLEEMETILNEKIDHYKNRKDLLKNTLLKYSPLLKIVEKRNFLSMMKKQLTVDLKNRFLLLAKDLQMLKSSLANLNPSQILKRGYSIVVDLQGNTINSIKDININSNIDIILSDGVVESEVKKIKEEKI